MISFTCPCCKTALQIQKPATGSVVACGHCKTLLKISLEKNKTVLGMPLPGTAHLHSSTASPPAIRKSTPKPATVSPDSMPAAAQPAKPIRIQCPSNACQSSLMISKQELGRWVECPKCRMGFAAMLATEPPLLNEQMGPVLSYNRKIILTGVMGCALLVVLFVAMALRFISPVANKEDPIASRARISQPFVAQEPTSSRINPPRAVQNAPITEDEVEEENRQRIAGMSYPRLVVPEDDEPRVPAPSPADSKPMETGSGIRPLPREATDPAPSRDVPVHPTEPFPRPTKAEVPAPSITSPKKTPAAKSDLSRQAKPKIEAAIRWILKQQRVDGSWGTGLGENRSAIVATTSWCALTLLASENKHYHEIDKAANYIIANVFRADPIDRQNDQSNWRIALGGLFLCEYAAAIQRNVPDQLKGFKPLLEKIVSEATRRREKSGGWGHTYGVKNGLGYLELEVMSNWMLATLGACQRLKIKVPANDVSRAIEFIENCCNPGRGAVGYSPNRGQKGFGCPCRTGGAIFAFGILGQQNHHLYPSMTDSWRKTMHESGEGHGSLALGLLSSALAAKHLGEEEWNSFETQFFPLLLEKAKNDGSFQIMKGKTPKSVGGDHLVGAAYCTAVYTLILQLSDTNNLMFLGQSFKE